MKRLILIYLTSLVCSFFFYTNAQVTSSKHNLQIINVNTENYPEAIFVEFTVTDEEGYFVPNLTVDDFIVKDNGTKKYGCKRLVQDLSELRLPVDIVFLVDNSYSMNIAQNKINNAIPLLLNGLKDKGDIRVALARFGELGYTNNIINCEEHKWATIEKNNLGFMFSPLQNDKDITYFKDSIWSKNKYDGEYEPFYNVLYWASQQDFGYRADALKIFILLGNASTINKFARPIDQYTKLPDQGQGTFGNHKMSSVINALKNVGKTSY